MVGEVNKIVYNMLISGKGVFLPEVGTLYIEHQGARKLSENRLAGPRNIVTFASQPQAPSLVEEIVSVAGCSAEQAQDIYNRWLQKTRQEGVLTIEGVGVLKGKSFVADAAFNSAINPKGVKTIVIRRKSHAWIYVLCALCVAVAMGFFAYIMWGDKILAASDKTAESEVVATSENTVAADSLSADNAAQTNLADEGVVADDGQSLPSEDASAATNAANTISPENAEQKNTVSPATHKDYFAYYVVAGVFSTEQNAERAVASFKAKVPNAVCAIVPRGEKYMVTLFGSDKQEECTAFINANRDLSPELSSLWIYNKR